MNNFVTRHYHMIIVAISLIVASIVLSPRSKVALAFEFDDGPIARKVLTRQVSAMFSDGKFSELDAMAEQFRTNKSRYPDGVWKLLIFYTAFNLDPSNPERTFTNQLNLAEEWRKTRPKSVTAQCVLASTWADYAWKARGGGYASKVKDEAWPIVRDRLEKAWNIINQPISKNDCPQRHNLRLTLAKAMGLGTKDFEALFQEAIRQSPGYYHHYTIKADYLLPKWYGNYGEWQQYISEVFDKNPQGEGATIYARTVWSMFLGNNWQTFGKSGVSWPKMKAGFVQIDRNYPDSAWILNTFAKFACKAGDQETLLTLFKRIDLGHFYPEAWNSVNVSGCRKSVGLTPQ